LQILKNNHKHPKDNDYLGTDLQSRVRRGRVRDLGRVWLQGSGRK